MRDVVEPPRPARVMTRHALERWRQRGFEAIEGDGQAALDAARELSAAEVRKWMRARQRCDKKRLRQYRSGSRRRMFASERAVFCAILSDNDRLVVTTVLPLG